MPNATILLRVGLPQHRKDRPDTMKFLLIDHVRTRCALLANISRAQNYDQ